MSDDRDQPRLTGWNQDGRPRLRGTFPLAAYRELGLGKIGEVGFAPGLTSARDEVSQYRDRGLSVARDVERNSETVRGGLDRKANTVVGPSLRPNFTPDIVWLGQDSDWMLEYQLAASSAFNEWATDTFCRMDAEGHYDFGGLMWQAYRTLAGPDSEVLGYIGYDRERADDMGAKWATYVSLIDPDRLENPNSAQDGVQRIPIDGVPTDVELRGGREVDRQGAMRALHVRVGHPGESSAEMPRWERLPRWTDHGRPFGFHWFFKRRAGLQRALTTLAAVLSTMQMLSHHSKATLQTAVSHAYMAAYLKTTMTPEQAKAHMTPEGEDGLSEYDYKTAAYSEMDLKFGGKRIPVLGPNDEIVFESLDGSSMDFDPFRNAFLRELASALGVSFEQLSLDFSRASYASTRSSILEAWRQVNFERAMFTRHVAGLVADCVIEEAFALGILKEPPGAPSFYEARQAYTRCTWTGPGMGWVDPLKEIDATKGRMGSLVTSPEQEASAQGGNIYENILQTAAVSKFADKHNVTIDLGTNHTIGAEQAAEEAAQTVADDTAAAAPPEGN